jgi:hypothetical protein
VAKSYRSTRRLESPGQDKLLIKDDAGTADNSGKRADNAFSKAVEAP